MTDLASAEILQADVKQLHLLGGVLQYRTLAVVPKETMSACCVPVRKEAPCGGVDSRWSPQATALRTFPHFNQDLFTFPAPRRRSDGKIVECKPRIFHQLFCARLNFFSLYLEYLGWQEALKNNTKVVFVQITVHQCHANHQN